LEPGNHIGGEGIRAFALTLKENKFLQDVDFSGNEIDHVSVAELLKSLKNNLSLKHLGMAENHLGDDGAKVFSEMLKASKTLKTLKLSCTFPDFSSSSSSCFFSSSSRGHFLLIATGITSVGAIILAENVRYNFYLTTLVLSENDIGDEGAKAFAQMIRDNRSLRDLHLNCKCYYLLIVCGFRCLFCFVLTDLFPCLFLLLLPFSSSVVFFGRL
jgi:hypothetical protein